jgi:hypothetical protein
MDVAAFTEGLAALPLAALVAVGTSVFLLAVVVLRAAGNHLNTKAPPVFEGVPFVGGIIKFVQARPSPAAELEFRTALSCLQVLLKHSVEQPRSSSNAIAASSSEQLSTAVACRASLWPRMRPGVEGGRMRRGR